MSAQPECVVCGNYINHGPVTCSSCDGSRALRQAIRDFAGHQPLDLLKPHEIQLALLSIAALGEPASEKDAEI